MLIGRQSGNFRIKVFNLKTNKSKTITLHVTDQKLTENDLIKKIIEKLTEE